MTAPFDLLEEAKRLVRFNTVTSQSNADCAVHVGGLLRKMGLEVSYQESRVGSTLFMNVAGVAGRGKGPLLLSTHLDTVAPGDPALWTRTGRDPWRLTRRGPALYGLGAADTKLDLLCKLLALARVQPVRLKRPVLVLGTFGEESGLRGMARFCQGDLPRPQMALVGEPTELAAVTRHKGLAVWELIFRSRGLHRPTARQWCYEATFQGQASHSSTPALGVNALTAAFDFLGELQKRFGKVTVLAWEGGSGHNVIPDRAQLRFSLGDRPQVRFPSRSGRQVRVKRLDAGWYPSLPWRQAAACFEILRTLLAAHEKRRDNAFRPPTLTWNVTRLKERPEGWTMTWDVRPLPGQSVGSVLKRLEASVWKKLGPPGSFWQVRVDRDNPGLDLPADHPLVKAAQGALRSIRKPTRLATKAGCSEAGLLHRVGVPALVFGPGRATGNIHRPNESVAVAQLTGAIRFYEAFLRRVCL